MNGNQRVYPPSIYYGDFTNLIVLKPTLADFPVTGRVGVIYIAEDTSKTYIWDQTTSTYIEVSAITVPGGANTQVQFNDSGAFGGNSGFTYNKASQYATLNELRFLDNKKAIFGTGIDGEIYSDGNDLIIRSLTQDKFTRFFGNDGGVDTELLTIDFANKHIGINDPSPSFTLCLADKPADFAVSSYSSNSASTSRLFFLKSHTDTLGNLVETVDGELLGRFLAQGVNSSSANATGAIIEFQQNGAAGVRPPTDINFKTATSSANAITRITVKTDGSLDFWENPLTNVGDITHDDATPSDWIFRNSDLDKFTRLFGNSGGADTELVTLDFANKRFGLDTPIPQAKLEITDATTANTFWTRTGGAQYILAAGLNFGFFGTKTNHENRVLVNDIPRLILDGNNLCFGTNLAGGVGSCLTNANLKFRIDGANDLIKIPYDDIKLTFGTGDDGEIYVNSSNILNINSKSNDLSLIANAGSNDISLTGDLELNTYSITGAWDGTFLGQLTGDTFYVSSLNGAAQGANPTVWYNTTTGEVSYDTSSLKYKNNIRDLTDTNWIYDLKPRLFDEKDGSRSNLIGLIAEEVELINPDIVFKKPEITEVNVERKVKGKTIIEKKKVKNINNMQIEGVGYQMLIIPMLKEIQKLKHRIDILEGTA